MADQLQAERELLDSDGENRAVRAFLSLYGGETGLDTFKMRNHMAALGFDGLWPSWANETVTLTKGGAQDWIRHLFSLEPSLSSSQQVMEEPTRTCPRYGSVCKGYRCTETCYFDRSLSTAEYIPSQTSSVAMTDADEFYVACVKRFPDLRAGFIMEIVDFVRDLLQSSPKGASTGTEPVYYRYRHSEGENWHYGPAPQSWWECQGLAPIASLSSPQEASKPQDEREAFEAWQREPGWKRPDDPGEWAAWQAACTWKDRPPQPSAASGRELPIIAELIEYLTAKVRLSQGWVDRNTQAGFNEEAASHQVEVNKLQGFIAALTSAAPADANVGGKSQLDANYFGKKLNVIVRDISHYTPQEMARELVRLANVADESEAAKEASTPTAPEPSAPADKVDAELTRLREIAYLIGSIYVHGNFKAETTNERELENLLRKQGTFWDSLADFDAAIDRIRSESGKGGKL